MRVLQVGAEVFPLVKTGGLADVLGALPQALGAQGVEPRLLLPGLPAFVDALLHCKPIAELGPAFGAARVRLLLGQMPGSHVPAYVIDAPYLYRRNGSPYESHAGAEWPDNLQRFALLGWAAAQLAAGEVDAAWAPQVVHAHDWHAAMACAYLATQPPGVTASVFTVHNLAYQGLFPQADFHLLGLPSKLLTAAGLEFHHQVSFMKAGLKFADRITTVSPTYAREIATAEFGFGLDGVIRGRGADVSGILNGIDDAVWDPSRDTALAARYSAAQPAGKAACKAALQAAFGLEARAEAPLFAVVSRLTPQKGLDLLLAVLPALLRSRAQLIVQGTGDAVLEQAWRDAAQMHAGRVGARLAYDEVMAHRMVAGADVIAVPSRFEPCGLTQMYGLRYGTLPLVRRVGGLADTVVDATEAALADGTATGFAFGAATPAALEQAITRAVALFGARERWAALMRRAMAQDFSWGTAAERYAALYAAARQAPGAPPRA